MLFLFCHCVELFALPQFAFQDIYNTFFFQQTMSFVIIYRCEHPLSQLKNICRCAFDQSLFHFSFNLDTTPEASTLMEGHNSEERRE